MPLNNPLITSSPSLEPLNPCLAVLNDLLKVCDVVPRQCKFRITITQLRAERGKSVRDPFYAVEEVCG